MTTEAAEDYEPSRMERLRVAAEYVQFGTFILLFVVLVGYPAAIIRGEATRPREAILGMLGLLVWAFAAATLGEYYAG